MAEPPTVWLFRHGATEWSVSGRHTGRTDVPLTPLGVTEARALARQVPGGGFGFVLTSPLQRAKETCELSGAGAGAESDPDLVEWDYGDYEGLTTPHIRSTRPDWYLFDDGCPGGEQAADVGARVDRVIARILAEVVPGGAAGSLGPVALFAHGHVLRVLAARWVRLPPTAGSAFALDTASMSVLDWEHGRPVVRRWNDTSHLQAVLAAKAPR